MKENNKTLTYTNVQLLCNIEDRHLFDVPTNKIASRTPIPVEELTACISFSTYIRQVTIRSILQKKVLKRIV